MTKKSDAKMVHAVNGQTPAQEVKIDLHTHSVQSPDGGLTADNYRAVLQAGLLDVVAITDHDGIAFAQEMQQEFGDKIIVGQEVRTNEGEIIGLYLTESLPADRSPLETIAAIYDQGGLVYAPHPFETVRSGLDTASMDNLAECIDIIEVHNGRAVFQNKSKRAYAWAAVHGGVGVASSDAHAASGWGRTYTCINAVPTRDTLLELLQDASYVTGFPGVRAVISPRYNRLMKRYGRNA